MNTGKWLILGIFAVALTAGVAAWLNRYYRTDAVQAFWGEKTLDLIANAPSVDVIRSPSTTDFTSLNATRAKGMLNVRYMLGSDFTYDLTGEVPQLETVTFPWRLKFHGKTDMLVLEFSADCTILRNASMKKSVRLVDAAVPNLRSFF